MEKNEMNVCSGEHDVPKSEHWRYVFFMRALALGIFIGYLFRSLVDS